MKSLIITTAIALTAIWVAARTKNKSIKIDAFSSIKNSFSIDEYGLRVNNQLIN